MQELKNQEDREKFIEDFLNRQREAEENDEDLHQPEDEEHLEQEIPEMPKELATPISLAKQTKAELAGEKKKKKKKKKKGKTADLPEAGTDLADDYIEKHSEDLIEDPFDPSHSLAQRVEYAIWKYRKNHKFSDEKRAIFDNYLKFGCIKTGPNMFLGRATSADTPNDPEAAIDFEAAKTAIDSVPDDSEEGLEVNFTEVAQVYFGNAFIRQSRFTTLRDFIDAPALIDAFLRYLQIRHVAPEYADDIAGARAICAQAKIQLPKCKHIIMEMPGTFNKACADLFGNAITEMDTSWMTETTLTIQKQYMSFLVDTVGTTSEDTKKIVQKKIKNPDSVSLVEKREWVFVKVAEIAPYKEETAASEDLIQVKFENYEDTHETYRIYLEKKIVQHMMVGMVTALTLCRLSNGEWYLEQARRFMPTFYMEDDCMTEEDFDY
ncbi:Argonaute siRNA chaperone complex subunit Arb1-domain-containing protein [Gilbertella persicaria]|uniref:Argonaute siRNA chaperone complex subunit Arb1-domain-containing protein n=1 Tax=Gilbertella persicaria TaxID=101096 RepID=UPI00221EC509|nr:Argonaute siRNA chaperone complex subunit Arb1-domain-containing protein [Gilbertella persicaria]KAI8097838.1 Argonaute siRNA chaperone complex subunit Arb1-domain-containing protein [Gilbertella persicaria]